MKVTAVAADLVATGQSAPEYSVGVPRHGRPHRRALPIVLDPGSWIVRVSVNGSKTNGDTFAAYYDPAGDRHAIVRYLVASGWRPIRAGLGPGR